MFRIFSACCLTALFISPASAQIADSTMYVHYIDVGQGDATLLEFSCGAVLIDAGGQNAEMTDSLISYLNQFFRDRTDLNRTLESVIVTHNHIDHTRALREVVQAFTVRRVIHNGKFGSSNRDQGDTDVRWCINNAVAESLLVIDVDDSLITGTSGLTSADIDPVNCSGTNPVIRILSADLATDPGWDATGHEFRNKNNHSIVVRVDFGRASFLFTGDLEEPAIETMVDYYDNTRTLDVDVYQVGHHGSYNGTTWTLVSAMSPEIAVFSCGRWDDERMWTGFRYGHPRDDAVDLLEDEITRRRSSSKSVHVAWAARRFRLQTMRDAIYATAWDGTVKVRATVSGRYRVTVER